MTLLRDDVERALTARAARVGAGFSSATAVTTDSRQARAGELFVALRGERFDGHDFVADVLRAGASAAVVDHAAMTEAKLAGADERRLIVVDDTLLALQDLAAHHLGTLPARRVALSGSNGKTTTKELIAAALRGALDDGEGPSRVLATRGNLNNHIGMPLTALELEPHHAVIVLEMGMNHFGELERLCAIAKPEVGLLTNIGVAHAGNLGGIEGVARAKGELFEGLAPGGTCVVNVDDARVVAAAERCPAGTLRLTFGRGAADVQVTSVTPTAEGMRVALRHRGRTYDVALPVIGDHNAVNAAGAVAVALALGLDVEKAAAGLAGVAGVPGRLRVVVAPGGQLVLDDTYNANPDSARAAVKTLVERAAGRRAVAALGNMLELGDDAVAQHAAVAEDAVKLGVARLFACGELGRGYVDGARRAGLPADAITWAEDSAALAPLVARETGAGDVVLVKGSRGARMERVVAGLSAARTTGEAG